MARIRAGAWLAWALAGLAAAGPARAGEPAGKGAWLGSFEAGRAAARQSGKPLFVVLRCEA